MRLRGRCSARWSGPASGGPGHAQGAAGVRWLRSTHRMAPRASTCTRSRRAGRARARARSGRRGGGARHRRRHRGGQGEESRSFWSSSPTSWPAGGRPPPAQLDAAWTAVLDHLREGDLAGLPLIVGGRSLGARVACRTAAATGRPPCSASPFRCAPGQTDPAKSRLPELDAVTLPTLVVQGESDPFGMPPPGPHRESSRWPETMGSRRTWTRCAPPWELVTTPGGALGRRRGRAAAPTSRHMRSTAAASPSPCSRTSERQVPNASACPIALFTRLRAPPRGRRAGHQRLRAAARYPWKRLNRSATMGTTGSSRWRLTSIPSVRP